MRYGDDDNASGELSKEAFIVTRRELARWKLIAAEYESRLSMMESSASWRYSAPIRLMAELLPRWRAFVLLGILAVISLPLWPLIIILALAKPGRDFLWSSLSRIGPAGQLLQDIYARLSSAAATATPDTGRAVYVLKRPFEAPGETTKVTRESGDRHLLAQLSPQNLATFSALTSTSHATQSNAEIIEIVSHSSVEKRLMMLYSAHNNGGRSIT